MEDPRLVEYFKKVINEVEGRGFSPLVVRESFDKAAPRLVWQHKIFILFIDSAAVLLASFLPPLIIFASLFLPGNLQYVAAAVLLGSAGLLYYFAISAFIVHEYTKLAFTFFMSILIGAGAYVSHFFATLMMGMLQEKLAPIVGMSENLGAAAAMLPKGAGQAMTFASKALDITAIEPISLVGLLIVVFLAYNLWPLLFWLKDAIESKRSAGNLQKVGKSRMEQKLKTEQKPTQVIGKVEREKTEIIE